MVQPRTVLWLCAALALLAAACRTQLLPDGELGDAGVSDASPRDLTGMDGGGVVDLAAMQARTGLPCAGRSCGPEEFCILSDTGPVCNRARACRMTPTCACFTSPGSGVLQCSGAICAIDSTGDVICTH